MLEQAADLETPHREPSPLRASVITVNTNERHRLEMYLPAVVKSLGDFEIIISDNGSTDGSHEFLAEHFPDVTVVMNGRNLGFASANNRAAQRARHEILVFINPDTVPEREWLVRLLEPFRDPTVGLTTAKLLLLRAPDSINTCGNDMHVSGITMCRGLGQPRSTFGEPCDVAAVSGATFAIRRVVFEQCRGFDEEFFIYMEETDLSLRSRLAGWRCVYVPDSIVYHDYGFRLGPKKTLYQERNRYMMLLKTFRWRTLGLLLPTLALAEVVTWGFVIMHDRRHWRNKLRAYRAIWANWRRIMEKRREAQQHRQVTDHTLLQGTGYALDLGQVSAGVIASVVSRVFDVLFFVCRRMVLLLVRW